MDGLPPVVHPLASVHRTLDQLNHSSLLEVLGLLVLLFETLESGPQNSVDKFAQSFFESVGLPVPLFGLPALGDAFHLLDCLFDPTCFCAHDLGHYSGSDLLL